MRLTIGSRGSKLALWQAHWVRDQLAAAGYEIEVRIIKTTGDKLQAVAPGEPLPASMAQTVAEAGSKGLFIKEIEEALLAREIDVAVHSLKDLPTEQPAGLALGAVPQREDARDVFIARNGQPLEKPAARRARCHQQFAAADAIARLAARSCLCRDAGESGHATAQARARRL